MHENEKSALESITGIIPHSSSLLRELTDWIARAIVEEPEMLRRLLYKVDIPEAKAREAAAAENGPEALALMMIKRESEKAQSRAAHKTSPANEDADLDW